MRVEFWTGRRWATVATCLVCATFMAGCETFRDIMVSDGGRFLTDTFANSVGMMMDDKLTDATDGLMRGADAAELIKSTVDTALEESGAGAGWWKGTLVTLGSLLLGGGGVMYRNRLKASDPNAP